METKSKNQTKATWDGAVTLFKEWGLRIVLLLYLAHVALDHPLSQSIGARTGAAMRCCADFTAGKERGIDCPYRPRSFYWVGS